jgi:hypothetical protein
MAKTAIQETSSRWKQLLHGVKTLQTYTDEFARMAIRIVGLSPLLMHRISDRAKQELLRPTRKTAADRKAQTKHSPIQEYRDSVYMPQHWTVVDGVEYEPPLLGLPGTALKSAMKTGAVLCSGITKADIGRLVHVVMEYVPVWGVPKLHMTHVRCSDRNRTPDVRTRAILEKWATLVVVDFARAFIAPEQVLAVLATAGICCGVGDWRPELGGGAYGQFRIVPEDNDDWQRIVAEGGAKAQQDALENPEPYNEETRHLLTWWLQIA